MQMRMMHGVENGQQDNPQCTGDGKTNRRNGTCLIPEVAVARQLTGMSQPSLT